mmetsp:Transcript_18912/g.30151  ORF Transcript_18912/g.30151 Transcript_18912/m.30151 type:complete len:222 (-) Transcript_18912:168-833(-)
MECERPRHTFRLFVNGHLLAHHSDFFVAKMVKSKDTRNTGAVCQITSVVQDLQIQSDMPHNKAALNTQRLCVHHFTAHHCTLQHCPCVTHLIRHAIGLEGGISQGARNEVERKETFRRSVYVRCCCYCRHYSQDPSTPELHFNHACLRVKMQSYSTMVEQFSSIHPLLLACSLQYKGMIIRRDLKRRHVSHSLTHTHTLCVMSSWEVRGRALLRVGKRGER